MTFSTDKIDMWIYIVVFIFVVIPFTWKKIKTTKESIREMLDIKENEETRKKEHDLVVGRVAKLEDIISDMQKQK